MAGARESPRMPQFVVVGHDAPTTPDFELNDLPGAGRLDLLCRCITSVLLLSHSIRTDATAHLVLQDEFTLRFEGASLRNLRPDERSTAALVRTALQQRAEAVGHVPVETSPGVFLSRTGLATTLDDVADGRTVVQLHEDGTPLAESTLPTESVFVLSDHHDFTSDETALLEKRRAKRVSVGPKPLHADQAITVAHNYLDTDGYASY